jgi:predicted O-linked N-acetylglucosamine transferase (SPINDLY family)
MAEAYCDAGQALLEAGRREAAVLCFQRAIALEPGREQAHYQLGYTFSLLGRLDAARDGCRRAIALRRDYAEAYNNIGYSLFAEGRFDAARHYFFAALAWRPAYARACYNAALCLMQTNDPAAAVPALTAALRLQPDLAEAHYQLAEARVRLDQWEQAVTSLRRAISLQPAQDQAHYRIGKHHVRSREFEQAADCFRRVITLQPGFGPAYGDLNAACVKLGRREAGLAMLRQASLIRPYDAEILYHYGEACIAAAQPEEAITALRRAVALCPDHGAAHVLLGNAVLYLNRPAEAARHYLHALTLRADPAAVYANLGSAYQYMGQTDEAAECYAKALEIQPDNARMHHNLGAVRHKQGRLDDALRCFERALAVQADCFQAYDSALFCQLYMDPAHCPATGLTPRDYSQRYEAPLRSARLPHERPRLPDRRLRVAYLSPDFRQHSVAYFMEPILAQHDRRALEIYCYYNYRARDAVTERLIRNADRWCDCAGLSDAGLAARIRADGIDILVDLAGHTGGNRLLVFARKPAPVQVSYLGYPATTGLEAMDWRLVTADTDPPGAEVMHSERLYRLPHSLWCYRPDAEMPEVRPEAAVRRNGFITFAALNNVGKVSDAALAAWARVLQALPQAQLVFTNLADTARRTITDRLAAHGIAAQRLRLYGSLAKTDFYALLNEVDIALDTFPYNGTTTTCETLWMGIPVISLIGASSVARSGYALLKTVGLEELAAHDAEGYVRLAVALAGDPDRLSALRAGMRARVSASALRDEAGMACDLEAAYRHMWQAWCRGPDEPALRREPG